MFIRLATLTFAVSLLTGASARAECVMLWKDIKDAKRLSAVVFSGTVVEMKGDPDGVFVTFDVDRVWKGRARRRLVMPLHTSLDSFRFENGRNYVVFADRLSPSDQRSMRVPTVTEPVFDVSSCSPTKPLDQAKDTVAILGRSTRPE